MESDKAYLTAKLRESGEWARLKQLIVERLASSGWKDNLKEDCIDFIKRKGVEKITINEIVAEIAPRGRSSVPDSIKAEVVAALKVFADENAPCALEPASKNW